MTTDTHTLGRADALRLLRDSHCARIGFSVDGEPFVVPATVIVKADGRIDLYLDDAHALRHLAGRRVAVEVEGRAPRPGSGWYVVARGVAQSVTARQFVVVPSAMSGQRVGHPVADNWFAGVPAS